MIFCNFLYANKTLQSLESDLKVVNSKYKGYDVKDIIFENFSKKDGSFYITISYLNEIRTENIKEFIEIEPKVKFFAVNDNDSWQLRIYGDFKADTKYSIKLKSGIKFYSENIGMVELKDDFVKEIITTKL